MKTEIKKIPQKGQILLTEKKKLNLLSKLLKREQCLLQGATANF